MYVAVLSSDRHRAERFGEQILEHCLNNGCYITFFHFGIDDFRLEEFDKRKFNTAIIIADSQKELTAAEAIFKSHPEIKLILSGSDLTAAMGYSLNAHYCTKAVPDRDDLERITEIIFRKL